MMKTVLSPTLVLGLLCAPARGDEKTEFFEKKIRPVLVEQCLSCHSAEAKKAGKLKGGLLLDTRAAVLEGGDTGPALVPGKPKDSLLLKALKYEGDTHMPPKGKLPEEVAKDFEQWIAASAVDPREGKAEAKAVKVFDVKEAKKFWAFQPPKASPSPAVQRKAWATQPIDGFILKKLEELKLLPAPEADKRTLLRRATFDLTGLPPTPEDMEAFLKDESKDAYAKAVERLLASPAYGEKWARLWLDVARYAEDQAHIVGNDASLTYPNAYLYRDWVINALNEDLPYDRFLKLQLAADVFEGEETKNIAALGFIGLGPKYYRRGAIEVMAEEWEDRVDVVARGLQGLTVACARCHDHKYDPIRTEDYYGLAGVFAGTQMFNKPMATPPETKEEKQGEKKNAKKDEKKEDKTKALKESMHIVKEGKPTDLNVMVRGEPNNKGPMVERHFPPVLCDEPKPLKTGSGRKDLAEAVTDKSNPLTARVIVNRVWAVYFGRGLVATPSNFGFLGDRPTHPELLDDLAFRFMKDGWSLKKLHREIVLSSTYRQASKADAKTLEADPDNRWLGRMPRKRLTVEGWRDAVLATAGTLETSKIGGPSINPLDAKATRRTVYSQVSRLEGNRMLANFDFPDPNVTAEKRAETTTPLQKLFALNSPFMAAQAKAFADKLAEEYPDEDSDADRSRIKLAYETAFGRLPTDKEAELGLAFVTKGDRAAKWKQYAHTLLMTNEMLYVD